MKYLIVAIFALVVPSYARPQAPAAHPQAVAQQHPQAAGDATTPVTIVSQSEVVGADGTFNYSYEASNGIRVEQDGYIKQGAAQAKSLDPNNPESADATGEIQVIQGSYSYTAPDGQQISLKYVADDNGFQPEGAHLPTAPPLPEGIARSLEQQPQASQQGPTVHPAQPLAHSSSAAPLPIQQHLGVTITETPGAVTQA